jgi:hypothetical protein
MKGKLRMDELKPSIKALIMNTFGVIILFGLLVLHYWLPVKSVSYGTYNRIVQGLITSDCFVLVATNAMLVIDWVTLKEWFEFDAEIAKAIILASLFVSLAYIWVNG